MSVNLRKVLAAALVLLSPAAAAGQLVVSGPEFQVNTHTTSLESSTYGPRVGVAADGSFVVSWQDGEDDSASARRFDSSGAGVGTDFQILPPLSYRQALAVVPNGEFTIAWEGPDGGYYGIFAKRFSSSGSALGTEVQVNTYITEDQVFAAATADGLGNVLIVWDGRVQDGDRRGVFAQRFDSSGAPAGTEFQVNGYTVGSQGAPIVAGDPAGGFVVAWSDYRYSGFLSTFQARRYDASGDLLGSEFQVNTYTACSIGDFGMSVAPSGGLAAAWTCGGRDGDSSGIFARRFASSGAPEGGEFQVNTHTVFHQNHPTIAHDENDGFAITWMSDHNGTDSNIYAQHYDSGGGASGAEFQVNTFTFLLQAYPQIATRPNGEFVVVWMSEHQDGYVTGTFGRLLRPAGTPLAGKTLIIKNPPAGPAKNKVVLVSKDPAITTPQSEVGDPRCAPLGSGSPAVGGRLRVTGDGGDFTIDLPCASWVAGADRTKFTYRDASGTTCKRVTLSEGKLLKAVCAGPQVAYALGTAQSEVRASLSLGDLSSPFKHCVALGAATAADVAKDGSNGRVYKARDANAPAYCR